MAKKSVIFKKRIRVSRHLALEVFISLNEKMPLLFQFLVCLNLGEERKIVFSLL